MGVPTQFNPLMHRLSAEAQSMVKFDYHRRRKSKTVGYFAWFFLGWHYLYLRRVGLQFAFWITAGGFLIWWLVDLFRVGPIINRMNEDLTRDLITQYQSIYREPEHAQVVIMPSLPQAPAIAASPVSLALPLSGGTIAYSGDPYPTN